jgi:hypothetical protein
MSKVNKSIKRSNKQFRKSTGINEVSMTDQMVRDMGWPVADYDGDMITCESYLYNFACMVLSRRCIAMQGAAGISGAEDSEIRAMQNKMLGWLEAGFNN